VGISLGSAVSISFIRKRDSTTGWQAMLALGLGGAALAFPSYLVWGK
jgi:hypothetical protein